MTTIFVSRSIRSSSPAAVLIPTFKNLKWILVGDVSLSKGDEKDIFGEFELLSSWDLVPERVFSGSIGSCAFVVGTDSERKVVDDILSRVQEVLTKYRDLPKMIDYLSESATLASQQSFDCASFFVKLESAGFGKFRHYASHPFMGKRKSVVLLKGEATLFGLCLENTVISDEKGIESRELDYLRRVVQKRLLVSISELTEQYVRASGRSPGLFDSQGVVTNTCFFGSGVNALHIQRPFSSLDDFYVRGVFCDLAEYRSYTDVLKPHYIVRPPLLDLKVLLKDLSDPHIALHTADSLCPLLVDGEGYRLVRSMREVRILWCCNFTPWWFHFLAHYVLRTSDDDSFSSIPILGSKSVVDGESDRTPA